MKWAIYTLLLANLAMFVWHFQPKTGNQPGLASDQLTRLVLVKEYEQQLHLAATDGADSRCFSLGPFTRRSSFNAAKQKFIDAGINVFSRVSSDSVRNGYWVMLPVNKSRNQAKVQIQKLREKGVTDYFLIAAGEMTNAVSLGVFSKPKLAKRRKDEVDKLGFKATIRKIAIPNRVYWLEWPKYTESQPSQAFLDSLREQFDGIGQTEKACIGSKNS